MQYRPLRFFWVAEFSDGTAISQFDPETGEEVQAHPDWLPSKVDKDDMVIKDGKKVSYREAYPIPQHFKGKKMLRIGWYPFSSELAKKIFSATGKVVIPSRIRPITIDLKNGEEPICYRSHSIKIKARSKEIIYAATTYVLGIKEKNVFHIDEDGKIIGKAS